MLIKTSWLWIFFVLVSCSDEPPVGEAVVIKVSTPHALVAFRNEGERSWQTLPHSRAADVEVRASGAYQVLFVCERGKVLRIIAYARTLDDERAIDHACDSDVPDQHLVFGRMSQPDTWLALDFATTLSGTTPEWSFSLDSRSGIRDLAILSGTWPVPDAIAVRRDIEITGDLDLGLIDIAQNDLIPLERRSILVANAMPGEELVANVALALTGTLTVLADGSTALEDLPFSPQAILRPTDRHRVQLTGSVRSGIPGHRIEQVRTSDYEASTAPSALVLPEPIGAVVFERDATAISAAWTSLPPDSDVSLHTISFTAPIESVTYSLYASHSFIEAADSMHLALDLGGVPGFKREWHLEPNRAEEIRSLIAEGPSRRSILEEDIVFGPGGSIP